ncbi:MAG: class I SAM-dependent rRNA methyltransferase [Bacteroidia bacterium]|nr:class I SAM-dependent rRNA methyltransferase [Bacteroidia bacterium]
MQTLILKPGRERSLINRHPWVFSGAVKTLPQAQNGEIIKVCTNDDKLLGYGFFSPKSQITCRVFEFTSEVITIDANFWIGKIQRAYDLRKLVLPKNTNMYRLLFAEGDFFPGVIIDVYADTAVVQFMIKGTELISEHLFAALHAVGLKHIYIKTKQSTNNIEDVTMPSGWIGAEPTTPISATENGITFLVDVENGQKTGFFIDQRENRNILGQYSEGKKVLNTFSYSGGFSLYALANNAALVHSVDSSKEAIEMCDKNVAANFKDANHQSYVQDVFEFLKQNTADYDIMVLDPPAFAKNIKSVPNACKGYKNLNLVAFKTIKPGGLIFTFSCSQHIDRDLFRKIVFGAAADAGRNVRIIKQLTQPEDHPINIYHPEGEYLKGLLLYVE